MAVRGIVAAIATASLLAGACGETSRDTPGSGTGEPRGSGGSEGGEEADASVGAEGGSTTTTGGSSGAAQGGTGAIGGSVGMGGEDRCALVGQCDAGEVYASANLPGVAFCRRRCSPADPTACYQLGQPPADPPAYSAVCSTPGYSPETGLALDGELNGVCYVWCANSDAACPPGWRCYRDSCVPEEVVGCDGCLDLEQEISEAWRSAGECQSDSDCTAEYTWLCGERFEDGTHFGCHIPVNTNADVQAIIALEQHYQSEARCGGGTDCNCPGPPLGGVCVAGQCQLPP